MSNWGKIALAVRCGSGADPMFFKCWNKLLCNGLRPGDLVLTPAMELPQHFAAEALANRFLKTPADSILYIDDDMTFEPEDLDNLRDDPAGQTYDMLMGLCLSRNPPHYPIIMQHDKGRTFKIRAQVPEDTIIPVAICGLGFTLIRRQVFETLLETVPEGEMLFRWNHEGDSEDASFSMLAEKAGCRLGVSTRVCIGHRIPVVVKWDHAEHGVAYQEADSQLGRGMPKRKPTTELTENTEQKEGAA